MSMIPAICPICGNDITVNNEKVCELCPSCGSMYIVKKAIEKYSVQNNVAYVEETENNHANITLNYDDRNVEEAFKKINEFIGKVNDKKLVIKECIKFIEKLDEFTKDFKLSDYETYKEQIKTLNCFDEINKEVINLYNKKELNEGCYAILIKDDELFYKYFLDQFIFYLDDQCNHKYEFVIKKNIYEPKDEELSSLSEDIDKLYNIEFKDDDKIYPSFIESNIKILSGLFKDFRVSGYKLKEGKSTFPTVGKSYIFKLKDELYYYKYSLHYIHDDNSEYGHICCFVEAFKIENITLEKFSYGVYANLSKNSSYQRASEKFGKEFTLEFLTEVKDLDINCNFKIYGLLWDCFSIGRGRKASREEFIKKLSK